MEDTRGESQRHSAKGNLKEAGLERGGLFVSRRSKRLIKKRRQAGALQNHEATVAIICDVNSGAVVRRFASSSARNFIVQESGSSKTLWPSAFTTTASVARSGILWLSAFHDQYFHG